MEKLPPVEEAVARLVVDLTYDVLSPEALEGARRLLQDQLGLQVGSSTLPWSRAVLEVARNRHVPGSSRTALTGDRMDAADAAFVNGAYGHGFEYDDAHAPSLSHPGSCVIPAALALGEELDADMSQVLEGIVAGYEVYTRIGTLAAPDILSRGFHPHAILSNFGAAAVVAKMRGFDLETTIHALAIAYSHASGATEYTSSGGSIKRVHAGIGTRNGMLAAGMAAGGLTGPTAFLTGGKGFFLTYVGREVPDAEAARFSLDKPFEIANPLFKPYCCCAYNHAFIDGARGFADRAEQIERVDLRIQPSGDVVIGNRNANAYNPTRIEQLQYSLPFQFALSVLGRGNGYATHNAYMNGELDLGEGGEIAAMANRVRIEADPRLTERYPTKMVGDITLTFRDGSSEHVFVEDSAGSAPNPMTQEFSDDKFRELTGDCLGEERSEALLRAVKEVDPGLRAVDPVSLLCRPEAG